MRRASLKRSAGALRLLRSPASLALLLIFALAFWARWRYALRTTVYTYDSYYYLTLGRNIMRHLSYSMRGIPHSKFLPLYPGSIAFTSLFLRDVELAGKLVNAGCFSLAVFPVYGIGRRFSGMKEVGLLAAFLLALEPLTVAWASLPMSEGLYTLLICLSVYFLVRWWQGGGDLWLWGSAAAGGLCAVTRWEGLLMMAVLGLPVLARGKRQGLTWKKAALAAGIFLLPFTLWCLRNLVELGHPLRTAYGGEIKGHPPEWEALGTWMRFRRYLLFSDFPPIRHTTQMYNYGLLVTGYAGFAAMGLSRRWRPWLLLFLPWLLLLGPFHFLWYFTSARFLVGAAPALCLGAGLAMCLPLRLARRIDARLTAKAALALLTAMTACAVAAGSLPVTRDIHERYVLGLEGPVAALAVRDASLWAGKNLPGEAQLATDAGPAVSFYMGRDALLLGAWQFFDPSDIDPADALEQMESRGVGYVIVFACSPDLEDAFRQAGMPPEWTAHFEELAVFRRETPYSIDCPEGWAWVLELKD